VQTPLWQVSIWVQPSPSSQPMPFAWALPVSMHCEVPVAHDVSPTWHGLPGGVQTRLAVHGTHAPSAQTWLTPQDLPFGAGFCWSVQTIRPLTQETRPALHGLPVGTQPAPLAHAAHWPMLQ
jgi:hypothetical protein